LLIAKFSQRDFLEPGGFGEMLGNDVSKLQKAVTPIGKVLDAARTCSMLVIHTREGHRADMRDVHYHKNNKATNGNSAPVKTIGETGPMGRILIRGEPGHDIVPELYPKPGEPVVDKPGKGSFYGTDLDVILSVNKIKTLLVCGVTTEVCVHTTVREANDRGYHCIVIADGCASFFDHFHTTALEMIVAQNGIFGSVASSEQVLTALAIAT
jgi:biuret amidohydrolase